MSNERKQLLSLIDEAVTAGSRLAPACQMLRLSARTIQRWRKQPADGRRGPKGAPANKLSTEERATVLAYANSKEFRELSPHQIVPQLADRGIYVASESTFYRVLREENLLAHRSKSKPKRNTPPEALCATGPNQVYSWDITYMKSPIKGVFYYLYMFIDVWSRKVVGWCVEEEQTSERAAMLVDEIARSEGVAPGQVQLHSDNGGPMKGASMLATLQNLGIVASFSRPKVSNDNPYSEALFRTVKYRPGYPSGRFKSLHSAREWVERFVDWYNEEHLHSGIHFVTPGSRHRGEHVQLLKRRSVVYEHARAAHPTRWSGGCRNWSPSKQVVLNERRTSRSQSCTALKDAA